MRRSTIVASVLAVAILSGTTWLVRERGGEMWPALGIGAIIILGPLLALALRRRRESRTRSQEPDSIERSLSTTAQSSAFRDVLVATAAVFLASVLCPSVPAAVMVLAVLVIAVVDFWVRYSAAQRVASHA
jgi:hypothetical protein